MMLQDITETTRGRMQAPCGPMGYRVWICVHTSKLSGNVGGLGGARPRLKKALIESTEKLKQWTGLAKQHRITSSKAAPTWHVLPVILREFYPKIRSLKQTLTPDGFGRLELACSVEE